MNDTEATEREREGREGREGREKKKKLSVSGEYHSVPVRARAHTHARQTHSPSSEAPDCPVPHIDILLLRLLPDITMRCKTKDGEGTVSRAGGSAPSDMLTRARLDAGGK